MNEWNKYTFSDLKLRYQTFEAEEEPKVIELHGGKVNILNWILIQTKSIAEVIQFSNRFTTRITGLRKIPSGETEFYHSKSIHYRNIYT